MYIFCMPVNVVVLLLVKCVTSQLSHTILQGFGVSLFRFFDRINFLQHNSIYRHEDYEKYHVGKITGRFYYI